MTLLIVVEACLFMASFLNEGAAGSDARTISNVFSLAFMLGLLLMAMLGFMAGLLLLAMLAAGLSPGRLPRPPRATVPRSGHEPSRPHRPGVATRTRVRTSKQPRLVGSTGCERGRCWLGTRSAARKSSPALAEPMWTFSSPGPQAPAARMTA